MLYQAELRPDGSQIARLTYTLAPRRFKETRCLPRRHGYTRGVPPAGRCNQNEVARTVARGSSFARNRLCGNLGRGKRRRCPGHRQQRLSIRPEAEECPQRCRTHRRRDAEARLRGHRGLRCRRARDGGGDGQLRQRRQDRPHRPRLLRRPRHSISGESLSGSGRSQSRQRARPSQDHPRRVPGERRGEGLRARHRHTRRLPRQSVRQADCRRPRPDPFDVGQPRVDAHRGGAGQIADRLRHPGRQRGARWRGREQPLCPARSPIIWRRRTATSG